jgi:hypothetical protein
MHAANTKSPSVEQSADEFGKRAVKAILKRDASGLVILDGLAKGVRPIEQPPSLKSYAISEK